MGFSVYLTQINVTALPQGFGRQRTQQAPGRAFFKSRFAADIVSKRRISLSFMATFHDYDTLQFA